MMFKSMRNFYTNNLFVIFITLACSGCGTLQTLPPRSEYNLKHNERYEKTYCKKIPRIYSGVILDACMAFIGPPLQEDENYCGPNFSAYIADMVLSFALDTVALPYTTIRQFKDGSLRLKRKKDKAGLSQPGPVTHSYPLL